MLNARAMMGSHDILMVTLDTLRYDVAEAARQAGETPVLNQIVGPQGWEKRHTPGTFTLAAHQAFFAGFLPTPAQPGVHPRLFAASFDGSRTTTEHTAVFTASNIVEGFRELNYRTICIGGVGFFNPSTALGRVLPSYFEEAYWFPEFGVTDQRSTENQVEYSLNILRHLPSSQRVFFFLNVSALHQPNYFYLSGEIQDSIATHRAALHYVDGALQPLINMFRKRGPTLCLILSDHGTAYGEDSYFGHRCAHPSVFEVPFAVTVLS